MLILGYFLPSILFWKSSHWWFTNPSREKRNLLNFLVIFFFKNI